MEQVLRDLVLQVIDLVDQVLLLLLLLVFVVVYALLQGELGLREPGQRVRVLFHVPIEAKSDVTR